MSKTIDNIKSGNYEVVDNHGVSITRHFTQCLEKEFADLEAKLAEKERQYETLYKLFSEQHEIIDQNELGCLEEVNRLLKEQKDFYIVEKVEYDKMKQGAKDIVKDIKQKLEEKEKEKDYYQDLYFKIVEQFQQRVKYFSKQDQDKISFAIAELEKVKEHFTNIKTPTLGVIRRAEMIIYIDNQIKQLKEGK